MIFIFIMMIFSFIMFFFNHPLSMMLLILIQTFLICLISGLIIETYWFSYILFLTFLGGLLVLFIYISSIASNEIFKFNNLLKIISFYIIMIIIIIMLMNFKNIFWMNFFINFELDNYFNSLLFFNNENLLNISKLYNNQTFLIMMMMVIYLFITLVAVVKITNIFYGPLRSNF
uniref:NADH dehydrogenase subunit 6 n=1 Tax=Thosea sinensis TaxID=1481763 RepID=UPI001EF9D05D|nr:NADH dehydrogenase subunit 6 [Thosea sinensis]ULA45473.1 NADH dehydrogenase subunit 6 [Thosea sinensis]